MHRFDYARAHSLSEALGLLAQAGRKACILAGGTDLVVALREENERIRHVSMVVDISYLEELRYIREEEGSIVLGPLITHADIAASPLIREVVPFLAQACSQVGSPQVRNRGTIGGNICNASPAADTLPVLMALDAEVTVQNLEGQRRLALAEFVVAPYKTVLQPGEMVTEIRFAKPAPGTGTCFLKLGRRKAMGIARLSVAVIVEKNGEGYITKARIAPGAALPVPARVRAVEEILEGKKLSRALAVEAGKKLAEEMVRITGQRWSTPYKMPVIAALTRRAILQAGGLEDVADGSQA